MNARLLFGIVLLSLGAGALYAVFRPAPPEAPPVAFVSSGECRACHQAVYSEWEASWHARSWTDPDVRALSNEFANTDCIDCHAPRPVFETGVGERVLPRSARRNEGVDCIACHALPGPAGEAARMAGTLERTDAVMRRASEIALSTPVGGDLALIEGGASGYRLNRPGHSPIEYGTFSDLPSHLLSASIDRAMLIAWLHGRVPSGPSAQGWEVEVPEMQEALAHWEKDPKHE